MSEAYRLDGRIALVTGAARGIGREISLELARAGAKVALVDVQEAVVETAKEVAAAGPGAIGIRADVTAAAEVQAAVDRVVKEFGGLHIAVANAGITRDGLLLRMKEEDWDAVLTVNLKAAFLLVRAAARPLMKAEGGRFIGISSVIGLTGNAGQANYAASKAGLLGLVKSVAKEFASRAVTANAICPGFIETHMTAALSEEVRTAILDRVALKRFGRPAEVASAVRFLASAEAGYITGQALTVDGGMVI